MAYTELSTSNELVLVRSTANNGAQIQDANPPPKSPSPAISLKPGEKVRNDDLSENLCQLIRHSQWKDDRCEDVVEFLDRNPHLDVNFAHGPELPLYLGCMFTNGKTVERLLAAGANPELFCGYGRNALQCTADTDFLDPDILSSLTRDYKQRGELAKYIDLPDQFQGRRGTHYVAGNPNQRLEGVDALRNAGADWTLKDDKGDTPFEWAAKNGLWILANYIANLQEYDLAWNQRDFDPSTTVNHSFCPYFQVNVQNTTFIQGFFGTVLHQRGQEHLKELISQSLTPEFRLNRSPENPVGGSGRESIYFSKKLDSADFMSIVIPYFSSGATGSIRGRKDWYKRVIQNFKQCGDGNFNYLGFQCASTLDEYCHHSLDEDILADRNEDQVLSRYQTNKRRDRRMILTVPQLWAWNFDNTVITAVQKPIFDGLDKLDHKLLEDFLNNAGEFSKALKSADLAPLKFSDLLVGVLISECVDKLSSPSRLGLSESIFGIFERSVSELSAKVREYTKSEALKKNNIDSEKVFILQIGDVREELSMIQSVLFEQEEVWRQFMKAKFPKLWSSPQKDQFVIPSQITGRMLNVMEILERPQTQFLKYRRQIAKLDTDAERVEGSITLQLDLKSKHASLQEAHLTTLMSAAVIGFTIVTIIFTPLAFLASLLALSTSGFQIHQSNSTLMNGAPFYDSSYISKWMVTIEFGSLIITGLAIWLALKFTTNFSLRDFAKQRLGHLKAWRQTENLQYVANAAQIEGQPAAARQATVPSEGSQSLRKRFQILPRGPRQQHAEEGKPH